MTSLPEDRSVPPPAPVPSCRLCVVAIGDAESVWSEPAIDPIVGPQFADMPVLASDGATLVVIGRGDGGQVEVWRGEPGSLEQVGTLGAELGAGLELVSLVRHDDRWHLFGTTAAGRAWHGTSADLVDWEIDARFTDEHPHLVVRGAVSMPEGVVLLGEVIAQGRRMGWTLLEGSMGRYRARELSFPLTAQHQVVGPVRIRDDEMGLVLSSGPTHLVARTVAGTRGRSWTLALLAPDVSPTLVLAHDQRVWVAGTDPAGGAAVVALVGGRAFRLGSARIANEACSGAAHHGQLVLARWSHPDEAPTVAPNDGATVDAGVSTNQSSPAYIDSISAA